ncbi:MAG: cell division protein ZapA [Vicinamibacteria bacterium]|nr:cell division protein ZapA [Vicinamibacteria bacterium]
MSDNPQTVSVDIFGQSYSVRAGGDPRDVAELAALVDARMREVSRSGSVVDTVRIAVLAALNIADECRLLKRQIDQTRNRADQIADTLDPLLKE